MDAWPGLLRLCVDCNSFFLIGLLAIARQGLFVGFAVDRTQPVADTALLVKFTGAIGLRTLSNVYFIYTAARLFGD